jgi:hypothetical protein
MTALDTHLHDLRQGLVDLVEWRRTLDSQTFETQKMTYRVEEDRKADLDKIRRDGNRRIERTLASTQESLRFARDHVQRSRVNANAGDRAQARVKELLERGLAPSVVLERAQELGDVNMVTALRTEMLFWGNEKGFADASQTIEATERTLAEIGQGDRRREARQALELRTLEQAFETISEVALRGPIAGRGRIAIGYAMEDVKRASRQTG